MNRNKVANTAVHIVKQQKSDSLEHNSTGRGIIEKKITATSCRVANRRL